jgi:hypothetical protein
MANHSGPIVVGAVERVELERLQRSPSVPSGLSRRARVVLLMAKNLPGVNVARMTGYTPVQTSRLRRRFAAQEGPGCCADPEACRLGLEPLECS